METHKTIIGAGFAAKKSTIRSSYVPYTTVIETAAGGAALSGNISCAVSFAGILKVTKLLSGDIAASTTWAGTLKTRSQLSGNIPADTVWTGTLSVGGVSPAQLIGDIPAAVSFAGSLTARQLMSGNIGADVIFAGVLKTKSQLVGDIAANVDFSSTLSIGNSAAQLVGNIQADVTFAGTLKTKAQLSGNIPADTVFASTLKTKAQLVGDIAADADFAGTLTAGGGGYDADAQAVIDYIEGTGATLDTFEKDAINDRIVAMKDRGTWTKRKAYYGIVGGTEAAHACNWKDPRDLDAAYRLTFAGGWTHDANGMTPNGSTGYADTHIVPSAVLGLNDVHMLYYSRTDVTSTGMCDMGVFAGSSYLELYIRYNSSIMFADANDGANEISTPAATSLGLFGVSRVNSTQKIHAKNSTTTTLTESSVSRPGASILIGSNSNNGTPAAFSARQCASASIGDGLTTVELGNEYTDEQAFQTALSRNV